MSDGSIRISVEVDGRKVDVAADSLNNLEASAHNAGEGVKQTEEGVKGAGDESQKASGKVKAFVSALGLVAVGAAAFKVLRASMDDAITRFDTLAQFPKVLEGLGASAEDSEQAMTKLSDGIDGLPTKLDDITNTTQRMYTAFDDADKAADSALAVNNALLSSSASANDARRGTEQYIQALQTGRVDMQQWRTLQETMNVGLVKVAEAFGFAGSSATNDLYGALRDGHITMDEFNDKLIEVGTGTGELASLAKENSLGIATSFGNLRYAVARGITMVITSFDNLSQAVTGRTIAENIDGTKDVVVAAFRVMSNVIEGSAPVFIGFYNVAGTMITVIDTLSPAIVGLATAYASYIVITRAGAVAIGIATTAKTAATVATYALAAAIRFLSGPVGWVVTGIGALATATAAVVSWFRRSSEEADRLNADTEELGDTTDELTDNLNQSVEAYKNQQRETENSAKSNRDLMRQIEELSEKENKSAADKALLQSHIESLNGSVEGLALAYDEETGALNMSNEELQARVDLMQAEEQGIAAQERLTEIMKEQNDAQMQLAEVIELRNEWNQKLEEGAVKSGEHKDAVAELDEQEQALKDTLFELAEQYNVTEEQIIAAAENAADAVEEGNLRQITSYEELEDGQKAAFDNMRETYDELVENATNAFDRMNEESKATAEEMIENLEHNQRMTEQWAENSAKLYDWAGKEGHDGFLQWLETMGPESAAELAVVSEMSDSELTRFAELMDKGAESAGENFKTSLGNEFDEAIDVMINFIDDGNQSMREQIRNSGFDEIGSMIPDGLVDGIEGGTSKAEIAAENLARDTTAATRKAFKTRSPSKVYEEIGGDLTDGLSLGVLGGIPDVLNSVRTMFNGVRKNSLDNLSRIRQDYRSETNKLRSMMVSQFNSIGIHSMAGLNSGLNAGSARVMATARNIANRITSTMQTALRIHSPSKEMEEDVGMETTAGLVVGIRKGAADVYAELNKLAQGMMLTSTPEMAIGTSNMAFAGSGQVVNNYHNSTTNAAQSNRPIKVEAGDVYIDGYKAGEVLWRPVKENIDRDTEINDSFTRG